MAEGHPLPPTERPQPSQGTGKGPAGKPAAGGHAAPAAAPRLDAKGEALLKLLSEVLDSFHPNLSAALDEVVVTVEPAQVQRTCQTLRDDPRLKFDFLRCLSVVDYNDSLQVVYHLWSMEKRQKVVVKADLPASNPTVPTVVPVWRGADWFEREAAELFGVTFEGHPNLKPLLLWEGFEGHPGLKSFPVHDYQEW
ncbi:MAG: NADH-quinone oxidoreductase subunit C [Chloroflexi bacterium]|nr:NADH-quinone oxidoreductase subunit C [Chloroflexota bacterium]